MGTNNFHYKNASRCFVVLESYEDDETGETIVPEQWEYQDFEDNFKAEDGIEDFNASDRDQLRSYGSNYLGSLSVTKEIKGAGNVQILIHAFIRSGYYEAACLDWQVEYKFNDTVEPGYQDWKEDLRYYYDYNVGMAAIQSKNIQKWIDKEQPLLIERMEKIFETYSTSYQKVGHFSNGEAVYQKA